MDSRRWERIQEVFDAALARGEAERAAFLAEACGEDAGLLSEVSALLAHHEQIGQEAFLTPVAISGESEMTQEGTPEAGFDPPGYQLLCELGRGGMGVVYLARHLGLDRQVAVKMTLAGDRASPQDLARLRAEVEALAALHHPNIVQILDVGADQGRPFFAMELVRGGSLKDRLSGAPLPQGRAATLVQTLARAVAAAHHRGIVHRDLKPANILFAVDQSGPASGLADLPDSTDPWDGIPKIGDFSLARRLGDDRHLTETGQILGTPGYMAPEQADGQGPAGPAVDVHALGAILYEMLTGRPPFRGATSVETIQQVRTLEPVRPRRLNPGVPRDLETICLKCLEKDPGRRYATAQDLADDLERYHQSRPLLARADSFARRARKWGRRNPAAAVAIGILGLLSVVLATATLAVWQQMALTRAAKARSDADLVRARKALESTLDMVSGQPHLNEAELTDAQKQSLLNAMSLYEQLALEVEDSDPAARLNMGIAYRRVAEAIPRFDHRDVEGTERRYLRSVQVLDGLVAEHPDDRTSRLELSRTLYALGNEYDNEDRLQEAGPPLERARLLASGLAGNPADQDARYQLGRCQAGLARWLGRVGRTEDERATYAEAVRVVEGLAREFPDVHAYQIERALIRQAQAMQCARTGRFEEAVPLYRMASAEFEVLVTRFPRSMILLSGGVGGSNNGLGQVLMRLDRLEEAEEAILRSLEARRKAHWFWPNDVSSLHGMALSQGSYGQMLVRARRHDEARKSYQEALGFQQQMVDRFPTPISRCEELAYLHGSLAWLCLFAPDDSRDPSTALQHARRANEIRPDVSTYQTLLGASLLRAGQVAEAQVMLRHGPGPTLAAGKDLARWKSDALSFGEDAEDQARAAAVLNDWALALCFLRQGDPARAEACQKRADRGVALLPPGAAPYVRASEPLRAEVASLLAAGLSRAPAATARSGRPPSP